MASVTVDSSSAGTVTEGPPLQAESIATVDLRLLSQSELYSLSLCSPAAFNPRCDDDVIIPKIDRSVFNESAGSRKQTYSRLRLAPAAAASSSSALRSRTPHLRQPLHNPSFTNDPENSQIVNLLKQLFGSGTSSETNPLDLVPIRVDFSHSVPVPVPESGNVGLIGQKRGRGRPRKNESTEMAVLKPRKIEVADMGVLKDIVVYQNVDDTRDKEMLNRDGERVDLAVLGSLGDPFGEELRRRTEGMRIEEELLRFMARTNGQWGSTRKKKRIVDASEFGNALPKGWKLLLSVKKKEGRVWLHCRRYISPNGRRFDTCKEISSYLLFLQGEHSENLPTHAKGSETVETSNNCVLASTSGLRVQDGGENGSPLSPAVGPEEVQGLLNLGELSEVQVGDLFHCDKCNVTFDCKEDLLQHQLSCHRRRKSRNGQSITDGVIIKEGKFECQFCHKTFEERHRYNGHIGAHIKNQVKPADGSSLPINIGECVEPVVSSGPVLIESTFQNSVVVSPTENADVSVGAGCNPVPACKLEEYHIETDNKLEGPSEAMDEETCADVSNKTEEPKQEAILCSNGVVDSCCIGVDDGSFPPKVDGSKAESDRFVESESTVVLCSDAGVLDENSLSSAKQVLLGPSGKNINVVDSVSSLAATSKDERDLNDNNLTTLNEHSCLFPHLDKRENTAERDASNISTCFIEEELHQEKRNESRLSLTCDKNSGVEVNDEQRSAGVLFSSTDAPEASSAEEYNRSYYPNLLNESKFGGRENTRHHDLNAVFGNSQMDDLGAKPNSTHHNRYVTEQTYETDKQGVGIDLSDPAIKGKMVDMESTFDMVFHSQLWDERKVDEVGESGKKIITGFSCGDANPNEDIIAGGLWRTGFENVMPGVPADNSTSVVQSSNCFQSFDVMSDKVQDLFGENEKYDGNTGFDGLRSDRSEPVEYSFMTTQSLNSLQEEPRVLPSFDMDIEQGFNSSFWLGKDDLMPNIGSRNQVTSSVCVWCRNEFYQEPNQLGAEAGSIGSMCPSCSGRISGQFSFL